MNPEWKADFNHPQGWTFEIEREMMREIIHNTQVAGFFLRVYDADGIGLFDYMQDELETAQLQAEHKWGVPLDCWRVKTQGDGAP